MPYDYSLEPQLKAQVKALVRRYDELKRDYEAILGGKSVDLDGQPRGTGIGDPTGQAAIERAILGNDVNCIETALDYLPAEYRMAVLEHVKDGKPWPDYGAWSTYCHYQRIFLYTVAFLKGWLYK